MREYTVTSGELACYDHTNSELGNLCHDDFASEVFSQWRQEKWRARAPVSWNISRQVAKTVTSSSHHDIVINETPLA
eukprot:1033982-Rhodomonas_salina.3